MEAFRQYVATGPLNFITLGYSNTGKTYFIGSLWRSRFNNAAPNKFSITGRDTETTSKVQEIYDVISGKKEGVIYTTSKMYTIELYFQKRISNLFPINITDVFGQATEKGRDKEEALKILETIPKQDGILLFIKTPTNQKEFDECIGQLNDLLELLKKILHANRKIPVALLLTQLDTLNELKNVEDYIERETNEHINIRQEAGASDLEINSELLYVRRDVLNAFVGRAINTPYTNSLIRHFEEMLTDYKVKTGVFPSTSIGFDNSKTNGNRALVSKNILNPYGTVAAFFWLIYQSGRLNPRWSENIRSYKENELKEELRYLYETGQAYEDESSERWGIQNITD